MCLEDWIKPLDAFNFHNHSISDNQIESILSNRLTFIDNRKDRLSNKVHARILEFNTKRCFICSFKEPRAKLTMHLNGATNNSLSYLLERNTLFDWRRCASYPRWQNLFQIGDHLYLLLYLFKSLCVSVSLWLISYALISGFGFLNADK